jgi:tetratricopeptide (TPR) repeat protein
LESIKHVKTATDSAYLISFYGRIAAAYSQTGSFAEAVEWNRKSLNRLIEQNQIEGIYTFMYDMTLNLIKLKRPAEALDMILAKRKLYTPKLNWEKHDMLLSLAECYAALNKYAIAEQYCNELIKLHDFQIKQGETPNSVIMYQFLANFYFNARQYNKAETYFRKTLEEWPKSGGHLGVLYKNKYLFRLDSAKGNYVSAINNLTNYHLIKDSINTAVKAKQIDELKIAYQTEQKDSLINLKEQNIQLLTKQDQLQKSKLQQGVLLRNISFAIAALLIIRIENWSCSKRKSVNKIFLYIIW